MPQISAKPMDIAPELLEGCKNNDAKSIQKFFRIYAKDIYNSL